jgi:hypothetical protein
MAANNQNVEALNAAQAAIADFEFGFAPLLEEEATRIVIEVGPAEEVARLAYPLQPADPVDWPAKDSFIAAYAVRQLLLESPQVKEAALSRFDLAAPIDNLQDRIDHVATLVRFADGSQAVVDLTPLASSFGARHPSREVLATTGEIESRFNEWRRGVLLNLLQPMKVVQDGSNIYYLLARTLVLPDHYEFSLRVHLTETATPIRPLRLTRGVSATVKISRAEFEAIRDYIAAAGPQAFNDEPALFERAGDDDPALNAVLDEHLRLLWHLITKLEHQRTTVMATATPTLTPTPTPTPPPTATPTRPALPLLTS